MAIHRKIRYWKLRTTELQLGERTILMGVLNVTPDSFSDGGKYLDPDRAYARALQMEEEGADIIDIGGESTRPDSKRISADEEWQRLVPVLKRLRGKLSIPLSIDTYKSEIAERSFDYGVEIVNDPTGLTFDPNIAKVTAQVNAALIVNHMRGTPETWSRLGPIPDVAGTITRELESMANRARQAGVEKVRIALDPGLGFGKRKEQNSEVIAQLGRLVALDYPVMVGPSRKAFLQGLGEEEPGYATAAAVAAAILNGADIVRIHDVKAMRAVANVADEIMRADAALVRNAEAEADRAATAKPKRVKGKDWMEPERPKPTRAPLAKPPVAEKPEETVEPAAAAPTDAPPAPPTPPPATVTGGDRPVPKITRERRDERPQGDRPRGDRPQGDRPQGDRPPYRRFDNDRPQRDRPAAGDRPRYGSDRPQYGDRPRSDGPPRRPDGDRPPRRFDNDGPPRKSFGDRPPRPQGDRPPPRRADGDRPPRRYDNDGPPRKSFGDRPPRPQGDRPPPRRADGDRPPRRYDNDGPPRKSFGDRPPRPQGDRPDYKPRGDRPPYGGSRSDGPPRSGPPRSGPPRSGPPQGGSGEWKERSRPPRPDGPGGGDKGRAPTKRPFRKRP